MKISMQGRRILFWMWFRIDCYVW